MWFISELAILTGKTEKEIRDICEGEGVKIGLYEGSNGVILGLGISDQDGDDLLVKWSNHSGG